MKNKENKEIKDSIEIIEDELRVIKSRMRIEKDENVKKSLLSFRRKAKLALAELNKKQS